MLESLKHRYVNIGTSVTAFCRLVVSPPWADPVRPNILKSKICSPHFFFNCFCSSFLAWSISIFCLFCRWPRRAPCSFVPLQISLPTMTVSWSKFPQSSRSCSFTFTICFLVYSLVKSSLRLARFKKGKISAICFIDGCPFLFENDYVPLFLQSALTTMWSSSENLFWWWTLWTIEVVTHGPHDRHVCRHSLMPTLSINREPFSL